MVLTSLNTTAIKRLLLVLEDNVKMLENHPWPGISYNNNNTRFSIFTLMSSDKESSIKNDICISRVFWCFENISLSLLGFDFVGVKSFQLIHIHKIKTQWSFRYNLLYI